MLKKILIVDTNFLFCKGRSALYRDGIILRDKLNRPVNGTIGFFSYFFKIVRTFGPYQGFLFCIDRKGSSESRRAVFPGYKSGRPQRPEDFYLDADALRTTYLKMLNANPVSFPGYEADDMIAGCCRYLVNEIFPEKSEFDIHILSNDKDICQCFSFSPMIKVIRSRPKHKGPLIIDRDSYLQEIGINNIEDLLTARAIVGDLTDNIPGIAGMDNQRTRSLLNNKNSIEYIEFMIKHKTTIDFNKSLLKLKDDIDNYPWNIDLSRETLHDLVYTLNHYSLIKLFRQNRLI
jgi:DNA polymerase-1